MNALIRAFRFVGTFYDAILPSLQRAKDVDANMSDGSASFPLPTKDLDLNLSTHVHFISQHVARRYFTVRNTVYNVTWEFVNQAKACLGTPEGEAPVQDDEDNQLGQKDRVVDIKMAVLEGGDTLSGDVDSLSSLSRVTAVSTQQGDSHSDCEVDDEDNAALFDIDVDQLTFEELIRLNDLVIPLNQESMKLDEEQAYLEEELAAREQEAEEWEAYRKGPDSSSAISAAMYDGLQAWSDRLQVKIEEYNAKSRDWIRRWNENTAEYRSKSSQAATTKELVTRSGKFGVSSGQIHDVAWLIIQCNVSCYKTLYSGES